MPIFNSEKYIEECLSSLLKQTFKNFEIICINDGSIDNTLEILKEFEKIDKRIHVFTQENTGPGIARNNGINKTKGEYVIFLDSDDIFEDTMLEELYSKIKGNDDDIVICNSNNFIFLNGEKKIIGQKNYLISDEIIIKNKSFSSLDIKSDFFNKFIWWPWDKIFKKKFIENLGIKYQNLNNSEDLFFIASAVIMAKKISYLDKIFINHRMGENTSISNSREKYWDNFYYALKELKNFLKKKGLYKRFKQDFINYVASFSLWNLETIYGKSFCYLYQKLKYEWLKEFGVNKYNKNYFYNIIIYKKVKNIMKTDLKFIKNINETKLHNQNKIKTIYLKEIKNKCSNKLKLKSNIFYFIFSNIK